MSYDDRYYSDKRYHSPDGNGFNRIAGGLLVVIICTLSALCLFGLFGGVGKLAADFLVGTLGLVAYAYAICGAILGVMILVGKTVSLPAAKILKYFLLFVLGVLTLHVLTSRTALLSSNNYGEYLKNCYNSTTAGGLVSGVFLYPVMKIVGITASLLIFMLLFFTVVFLSFYPLLKREPAYKTKTTKIDNKKASKGSAKVVTFTDDGVKEEVVDLGSGRSMFMGKLNDTDDFGEKKQKKSKQDLQIDLLYPKDVNAPFGSEGSEPQEAAPVFEDEETAKKRRSKEKLFGGKRTTEDKNGKKPEYSAYSKGFISEEAMAAKAEEDRKYQEKLAELYSSIAGGVRSNRLGDSPVLPRGGQSVYDRFGISRNEDEQNAEFKDRYYDILNSELTEKDIFGSGKNKKAAPKASEPVPAPKAEEKKEEPKASKEELYANGNFMHVKENELPKAIQNILDGPLGAETNLGKKVVPSDYAETNSKVSLNAETFEQPTVFDSQVKKPEPEVKNEVKPEPKPAAPEIKTEEPKEEKKSTRGSIFSLFGEDRDYNPKPVEFAAKEDKKPQPKPEVKEEVKPEPAKETPAEEKKSARGSIFSLFGEDRDYTPKPVETVKADEPKPAPKSEYVRKEPEIKKEESNPNLSKTSATTDFLEDVKPIKIDERKPADRPKLSGEQITIEQTMAEKKVLRPYKAPPIDLLSKETTTDLPQEDFSELKAKLEDKFAQFKIYATVENLTQGPTFSRFEMKLPDGVRVSKVKELEEDIGMALGGLKVRIEAPIPGKALFGVEVPNTHRRTVKLRTMLDDSSFNNTKDMLTFVVGVDIENKVHCADLATMPHLLVAGSTGSGKSVAINGLLLSLLYKYSPEDVRLILIDPKKVEFSIYQGIPHLLIKEIVTTADKAVNALNWAISEMYRRLDMFKEFDVRNIAGYNQKAAMSDNMTKIPQIVIVVDEMAELMRMKKREVEDCIQSLSAVARAAGIHLVIATQRPSVDVITGVIKSNLPARMALSVSQGVDSRTIIDRQGAEKLLGRGDMLFQTQSDPDPIRLQGCFTSDEEVANIISFIKANNDTDFDKVIEDEINFDKEAAAEQLEAQNASPLDEKADDPIFKEALKFVIQAQQATISKLQRKMGLGFGRAAKLIDMMEDRGYITAQPPGNKPREVLITMEEYNQIYGEE